jgi:ribonucleoside-triphosphate reductase
MHYTRIGIPVYDIRETIERERQVSPYDMNQFFGNTLLEEYTLTRVLPQKISDAYLNSDIFIHGLEQFITSPMTLQNDLRVFLKNGIHIEDLQRTGPAKKAEVAATHAVRILTTTRKYVGKGASLDFFNIFMAPYIKRFSRKDIEQICQAFLYELNKSYFASHSFIVNLDTAVPRFLRDADAIGPGGKIVGTYSDYTDEAKKFLKIFVETMQRGDYSGTPFRLPELCFKSYSKTDLKNLETIRQGCYIINQAEKNQSMVYSHVLTSRGDGGLRTGISQSISINLPKLTNAAKEEKAFYSILEHYLDLSKDIASIKRDTVKKRLYKTQSLSFLSQFVEGQEYVKFDDSSYLVSFAGLPQASMLFLGKKEYDRDCANFTERVIRFSLRKFRQYKNDDDLKLVLGETNDSKELERFSRQNKALGIGAEITHKIIPDTFEEKEDYYRNLQPLFDGGAFFDIRDNNFSKSKDFLFLRKLS